eukprot:TRINITY_DN9173_c0_g2_i1.p1 TRINITY_DN9173_c0_g2~~TRINITY_DN9173_c0_g2_i1.p1  ORF type:complete len:461 (+),score=79.20 TRINITY_DN9173_c0_g2_i1:125-1507(+)
MSEASNFLRSWLKRGREEAEEKQKRIKTATESKAGAAGSADGDDEATQMDVEDCAFFESLEIPDLLQLFTFDSTSPERGFIKYTNVPPPLNPHTCAGAVSHHKWPVIEFWLQLLAGEFQCAPHPKNDQFDVLTFFTTILGLNAAPYSLLVRSAYKQMHEHWANSPAVRFLIIGTPGIGKTMFLAFVLYKLAAGINTVLFQDNADRYFKLTRDGSSQMKKIWHLEQDLLDSNAVYVGDSVRPDVNRAACRALLVTSPEGANYKKFAQAPRADACDTRFMPQWTRTEFVCLGETITFPAMAVVPERAEIFGDVPRHVYNCKAQASKRDCQEKMLQKIGNLDLDTICKAVLLDAAGDRDVAFWVVHVHVEDETFSKYRLVWASGFVEEHVVQSILRLNENDLKVWLSINSANSTVAILWGLLYEAWVHLNLPRGMAGVKAHKWVLLPRNTRHSTADCYQRRVH